MRLSPLPNEPNIYNAAYFASERNVEYMENPIRVLTYVATCLAAKAKTVLDVGCGRNVLVDYLRKLGVDAIGIDFSSDSYCDILSRCEELPFGDSKFDIGISTDLLEHLDEVAIDKTIEELKRVANFQAHFICEPQMHSQNDDVYHITLKPREWWINKFKQHGLVPDAEVVSFVNFNIEPDSIGIGGFTGYIMVFRREE